jgi:hypothetical protein
MSKIVLIIMALALASASAKGIDVDFSSSNDVSINIDTSGAILDYNDNLWINGEIWNGEKTWMDQEGTIFNETWSMGKLHEKKIVWINGTQVIILGD